MPNSAVLSGNVRAVFQHNVERRFLPMRVGDLARGVRAIFAGPAIPQPVGRVEAGIVSSAAQLRAFTRDPAQHRIDQGFEMHGLVVRRRQIVGGIDGGMGRHLQDQKLAGPQQQNFRRWSRLVRRQGLGHELTQQRVQFAEMAQRLAGQGARETGIARREVFQSVKLRIQRLALAQDAGQQRQRRLARGKAGASFMETV